MHGGGRANCKHYEYLQKLFRQKGIASLVFDFMGCGESEGEFEDGTLNQRIKDAHNVISYFLERTNLRINEIYLWGSSLGGHVACRLLENHYVKGVILQSAAAYGKQAENAKFNDEFTKAIRKPDNWTNSPAFKKLKNFSGNILVVYGENDLVIPKGVMDRYHQITDKNRGKFVVIKNGLHALLKPDSRKGQEALVKLGEISSAYLLS